MRKSGDNDDKIYLGAFKNSIHISCQNNVNDNILHKLETPSALQRTVISFHCSM